jgi:hypothetical protein
MLWWFALSNQEVSTLPRTADPSAGRVCPRSIHGIEIYETPGEKNFYDLLETCSFVVFGMSAAVALLYRWKWGEEPRTGPPNIGMGWGAK